MNRRGVTLVELLVVVSIIAILAIALGFTYQGWMGRYKVERQTKDIFTDLTAARTNALTRSRMFFITLNATNYSMSEDSNDNIIADEAPPPPFPKTVEYRINWNGADPAGQVISFDRRGILNVGGTLSLTAASAETDPDYNCIILSQTRINMGKMNAGGNCDAR
jgi:prepilin-type N-terminal cleavage/methylation domain-containing protein